MQQVSSSFRRPTATPVGVLLLQLVVVLLTQQQQQQQQCCGYNLQYSRIQTTKGRGGSVGSLRWRYQPLYTVYGLVYYDTPKRDVVVPFTRQCVALPLTHQQPYQQYNHDNEYEDYYTDDGPDTYNRNSKSSSTKGSSWDNRPYWEEDDRNDVGIRDQYNYQQDSISTGTTIQQDVPEWEQLQVPNAGTVWVLLPSATVLQPTAILHFVGGTFTGSAPNIWYRQLLEDIVKHTSVAVVASTIPITVQRSPLHHVRLAQILYKQFRNAHRDILVDEYGHDTLQGVPICGLGHSLGARLLVVLTTLGINHAPKYKSMILISFTNFGAAAGIPGLSQLFRHSRLSEERKITQEEEKRRKYNKEERMYARDRKTTTKRRNIAWMDDDDNEDDDNDEDELEGLFEAVTATIRAGTERVQSALTPASSSLEFRPTPEQLWKAIDHKEGGRYSIPQTLIVQFDDDEIDQSSALAKLLSECSDVKFARLRGTHLTPVVTSGNMNGTAWLQQLNSKVGRLLFQGLQRGQQSKPKVKEQSFRELRQSIARYITEIVTKD